MEGCLSGMVIAATCIAGGKKCCTLAVRMKQTSVFMQKRLGKTLNFKEFDRGLFGIEIELLKQESFCVDLNFGLVWPELNNLSQCSEGL